MKKTIVAAIVAAFSFGFSVDAQAQAVEKYLKSYNMRRGQEAFDEYDFEKAISCFEAEISENPKNGYPYMKELLIYAMQENYEEAISRAAKAMERLPKKDKESRALVQAMLGKIYENMDMGEKALGYYAEAMKICPKDEDYVYAHINVLRTAENYDEQLPDIELLKKNFAANATANVYVGRYYNDTGDYDSALKFYSQAVRVSCEDGAPFSEAYAFRAKNYIDMEAYRNAAEDIVEALSIDRNAKALGQMTAIGPLAFDVMADRLKEKAAADADNYFWPLCLGNFYSSADKDEEALTYFARTLELCKGTDEEADATTQVLKERNGCYYALGRFSEALADINQLLEDNAEDVMNRYLRSGMLYAVDDLDGALDDLTFVVNELPWVSEIFSQRAIYYAYHGDYVKALEDLDVALSLDPTSAIALQRRATTAFQLDNVEAARRDVEAILALDEKDDEGNDSKIVCGAKAYAYAVKGDRQAALGMLERAASNSEDSDCYNTACILSILGDKDAAFDELEKALKAGFNNFVHLRYDFDLINLRADAERFDNLVKQYAK